MRQVCGKGWVGEKALFSCRMLGKLIQAASPNPCGKGMGTKPQPHATRVPYLSEPLLEVGVQRARLVRQQAHPP